MSTAVATAERESTLSPRHVAWGAIVVGVVAWFIALPPALVRSPIPSVVLGVVAIGAGIWVAGQDEKRLGWGAVAAGVIGAGGAGAGTQPGTRRPEGAVPRSAGFAPRLC